MAAPTEEVTSPTSESAWLLRPEWSDVPNVAAAELMQGSRRLLVVSSHPDDETLGAGGVIAQLSSLNVPIRAVLVTDGEASHPRATAWTRTQLSKVRRAEYRSALTLLAPQAEFTALALPDGGLADNEKRLAHALSRHVRSDDLVLAPWATDGHTDHDATGRVVRRVGRSVGCRVLFYPVWLWDRQTPQSFPWARMLTVDHTIESHARKLDALSLYRSQADPLGPLDGDHPILTPDMMRRAGRLVETLISDTETGLPTVAPTGHDVFDSMFDRSDDPWGFEGSVYEQRKRAIVLSLLSRNRYRRGLEIGCSTGIFTQQMSQRCEETIGMDVSGRALAVARSRSPHSIEWVRGTAPQDIPQGTFDLIVLSEVGYFLTPSHLMATLRRMRAGLRDGGELVLVHWRRPTTGIPLNGELVHRQSRTMLDLPIRVLHREDDFVAEVWSTTRVSP